MKIVWGMVALCWGTYAWADMPVSDPSNLLLQIDTFVAGGELGEAFHCGDSVTIKLLNRDCRFGCTDSSPGMFGGCGALCQSVQDIQTSAVTMCGKDQAIVSMGDGSELDLSAADFKAMGSNLIRKDLAELDVFTGLKGVAHITSVVPSPQHLASGKDVVALEIQGFIQVSENQMSFDYLVAQKVPGVAQILFKRIGGNKIFRVQDFVRK